MRSNRRMENQGKGILIGLENLNKIDNEVKEIKEVKETGKFKRSYMLTQEQINKVHKLRAILIDNDLSEIVGKAIDLLYKSEVGE